jgi:alpha-beta hydrolase superfamily lysophospholipase
MNAVPIALFIASLILPAGTCDFPESAVTNQSSGGALQALKYSAERSTEKEPDHPAVRWYERKDHTELKGVALVIHGLNVRPGKMEPIITQMTKAGIDCLNLSLRGHGSNYSDLKDAESDKARMAAFKSVSYPLWKSEAYDACQLVKKKCNLYGAPMFFVGFSMGGLLAVDLFTSNSNVRFNKMVLFAPAIKMRKRNYFLKIFSAFPKLVIPSMAHRSYLANSGTPMAAYNALFDMYQHFENSPDPRINVPTVVFIDKHDEIISFTGLQNMVRDQKLDQWEIHPVNKDKTTNKIKMHHLIIDEASVGEKTWQKIIDITMTHLLAEF